MHIFFYYKKNKNESGFFCMFVILNLFTLLWKLQNIHQRYLRQLTIFSNLKYIIFYSQI